MRARGNLWASRAAQLDAPKHTLERASRPAPRPPVEVRPKSLYVTAIQRLIRDPYAIYARYILDLRKLDPLTPAPDAPLRGQVIHDVLDRYMQESQSDPHPAPKDHLLRIADEVLAQRAPWTLTRRLWKARIERFADWFVQNEASRADASFLAAEVFGEVKLDEIGFTLKAKADRIDRIAAERVAVIDYKTGAPPTPREIEHFDKQLLLEALIAEAGGFDGIPASTVDHVAHIGLGRHPKYVAHRLVDSGDTNFSIESTRASLVKLLQAYADRRRGYAARPAMQRVRFEGDYDHLARFGEWDETQLPVAEDVG